MSDDAESVELEFPIRFAVSGTPVSLQGSASSRDKWKAIVASVSRQSIQSGAWASTELLSLTIYDFPSEPSNGDVDNIIKPIQDALCPHIYLDDSQVMRVVAQRFQPKDFANTEIIPDLVAEALVNNRPFVYIQINENPLEEAQ